MVLTARSFSYKKKYIFGDQYVFTSIAIDQLQNGIVNVSCSFRQKKMLEKRKDLKSLVEILSHSSMYYITYGKLF